MKKSGKVWKFAVGDINTDQIRAYMYSPLPVMEQAKHCLESIDSQFPVNAKAGDIVVAGENFGCGSSRPAHATFVALGIGAILAESFGRLFFRHSVSAGLLVLPCPGILDCVNAGDVIDIDTVASQVLNRTTGATLAVPRLAEVLNDIIECGGERQYIQARLARQRGARGQTA